MKGRLAVFNTLTGEKEPFTTLRKGKVTMFACGPTVQDYMHLGHARTYVFYDVVARYLKHLGNEVNFVINITDVDERITQEAEGKGEDPLGYAALYSRRFIEDMASIGADSVCRFEPVSGHVDRMIELVGRLVEKGYAYSVDGWVYFDVSKFPAFGRLSHQSRGELSLRPLELSLRKRGLLDFALWRPETLVEGRWDSPWGRGSPGWHIQDVAVTFELLGEQYDLHGGAYELIYPHHEAEIAEAEALTGKAPFVRHWVHTRLLNMGGRKMSKSVGNVMTVRDAMKRYTQGQLRFFLLGHHYRRDMDLRGLGSAARRFSRLRQAALKAARESPVSGGGRDAGLMDRFRDAMDDDFDTPLALEAIEDGLTSLAGRKGSRAAGILSSVKAAGYILGVDFFA